MNEIVDIDIKRVPRLRGENATALFCWDDCMATYSNYINTTYELMYYDALYNTYEEIKKNEKISIGSRICANDSFIENLSKYTKIRLEYFAEDAERANEVIKLEITKKSPILIILKAYNCPWDWRYMEIEEGVHTFFINGWDEKKQNYICTDPYYELKNQQLPIEMFIEGYQALYLLKKADISNDIDDIDLLKVHMKKLISNNYFENMIRFANDVNEFFDIKIEIKDFNEGMELTFDEVKEKLYLDKVLVNISNNRVRYAILMKYLAKKHPKYKNTLLQLEKDAIRLAEKWEAVRFMLIKRVLLNNTISSAEFLSNKIKDVIQEEKKYADNIIKLKVDDNITKTICKNDIKNIEMVKHVAIKQWFNSQGIGCINSENANLSGNHRFFLKDLFPNPAIILYKQISFKIENLEDNFLDNISCKRQEIIINEKNYNFLFLLGCSEWGDYKEDFKIVYEDGSKDTYNITFADWAPSLDNEEILDTAYKSKIIIKNDGKFQMSNIDHRLYSKYIPLNCEKKLIKIILPECSNIHIFAISLCK